MVNFYIMGLHPADLPLLGGSQGSADANADVQDMAELEQWAFHV